MSGPLIECVKSRESVLCVCVCVYVRACVRACSVLLCGCALCNVHMALSTSAVQPQKRHSAGSSDGEHAGKRPQLVTPPLAEDSSGTNSTETSPVGGVPQAISLQQQQ